MSVQCFQCSCNFNDMHAILSIQVLIKSEMRIYDLHELHRLTLTNVSNVLVAAQIDHFKVLASRTDDFNQLTKEPPILIHVKSKQSSLNEQLASKCSKFLLHLSKLSIASQAFQLQSPNIAYISSHYVRSYDLHSKSVFNPFNL